MNNFNWPVVGHQKIQQFLQKSLANNKLGHAYLFSGPVHLGKSLVAEKFMASILCADYHQQNKKEAQKLPCGECVFCQQFNRGIHPDVYFLKKDEDKKNISVEQVREMHKFLSLTSFLNSYKIALVANAQELSESAQNALLKVLEEPTPKTILILIVNDHNLLLPTISSRCQLVKFRQLSEEQIFHHLVGLGSSREQAKILTALSCGQIGLAIDYLANPELFNSYLEKMGRILAMFNQDL
ncbi:MAG: DNA polymerase III subunit delta', partial [Candidatus Parcubacteria bacterium]|nr:DNA polymerase III subunit delta' [Candidatus Parcubacteria bacterium]